MSKLALSVVASAASILLAGAARAETAVPVYSMPPAPVSPNAEAPRQHDGFYFRYYTGLGGMETSTHSRGTDIRISGMAASGGVAFGSAIARNLILFGELFSVVAEYPTVDDGGPRWTSSDAIILAGIGPGLAYYLEPLNLYLSATLDLTMLTSVSMVDSTSGDADLGGGLGLMIGKEWWVSAEWGLGVALRLFAGSNKEAPGTGSRTWTTGAFTVAFSATYN